MRIAGRWHRAPRANLYRMRPVSVLTIAALALWLGCCGCRSRLNAPSSDFDYYILSLSWSPEFCYGHSNSVECSQHRGFVVHGLWPQFRGRRGPEYCSHAPGPSTLPLDASIMPDSGLARHEWEAHGACSGLPPAAYFALVKRAFESIRIPRPLVSPDRPLRASPGEIIRSFERANPGFSGASIQLNCRGAYLQSVNICLTKNLRPAGCSVPHGCREPVVRIAAVR